MFCHTFLYRRLDAWQGIVGKLCGMRAAAGFAPLPEMEAMCKAQDRMIVTAVEVFDDAALPGWEHVRHAGPVLDNEARALPVDLPWAEENPAPLALLSFSTTELASRERFQTALDAQADLPVHVVATTGAAFDPAEVDAPANAHVVAYADHGRILPRAALAVTHGGHGAMMRALRHRCADGGHPGLSP